MNFDAFWKDNVYGFNEQLIASNGVIACCDVAEVLRSRLPGCVRVTKTDAETDRTGVDFVAELSNGTLDGVDLKRRSKDCRRYGNDDVALEVWSVVGKKIGWSRDESKACRWVLWVWDDTGRFLLLPFAAVCAVFSANWRQWKELYKTATQVTPRTSGRDGWKSECVFVPRDVLISAVVEWANGFA